MPRVWFAASFPPLRSLREIRKVEVIVLANLGDLSEESLEALRDGVRGGGGLLVYAEENGRFFSRKNDWLLVPLTWTRSRPMRVRVTKSGFWPN